MNIVLDHKKLLGFRIVNSPKVGGKAMAGVKTLGVKQLTVTRTTR